MSYLDNYTAQAIKDVKRDLQAHLKTVGDKVGDLSGKLNDLSYDIIKNQGITGIEGNEYVLATPISGSTKYSLDLNIPEIKAALNINENDTTYEITGENDTFTFSGSDGSKNTFTVNNVANAKKVENALTFVIGGAAIPYDGSKAKSISIPTEALPHKEEDDDYQTETIIAFDTTYSADHILTLTPHIVAAAGHKHKLGQRILKLKTQFVILYIGDI